MSKDTFLKRYALIITRLQRGPATFKELSDHLQKAGEIEGRSYEISKRTLQRDIQSIASQMNIEIVNEKKGDKRYLIQEVPETREYSQRLLESYQVANAVQASYDFNDVIVLDTRKPKGLDHFYGLLYAINNKLITRFKHLKYSDGIEKERCVHPLGLKEAVGRWYLVAVDVADQKLKYFGLDRLSELSIGKTRYREKYEVNLRSLFAHAFGIIADPEQSPTNVELKFNKEQGQYVAAYPIHHSQQVEVKSTGEHLVKLSILITYDFIKELLSYGPGVEVISPVSLRKTIKNELQTALNNYA